MNLQQLLLTALLWLVGVDGIGSVPSGSDLHDLHDLHASLQWHATGAGLHRNLRLRIVLGVTDELSSALRSMSRPSARSDSANVKQNGLGVWTDGCLLRLHFTIPNTMYMDMDELAGLSEWRGFVAKSDGVIDVEKPAHDSVPHRVAVFVPLNQDAIASSDSSEDTVTLNLALPVHLRYQAPSSVHRHANATIGLPDLNVVLPDFRPLPKTCRVSDGTDALSSVSKATHVTCPVQLRADTGSESITFQVPVGLAQHESLVVVTTLLVTAVVCGWLVWRITLTARNQAVPLRRGHQE